MEGECSIFYPIHIIFFVILLFHKNRGLVMRLKQDGRTISVHTPLGKDKLILLALSGKEFISDIFSFKLTMISEDHQIGFNDIIGKNVTISIKLLNNQWRYINGIVSRFSQGGELKSETSGKPLYTCYYATIVPQLWLLKKSVNSKIFQDKTVDEIIVEVLEQKVDQIETHLISYPVKNYCVQYQETDFNFVSRLMEEYGIYYYFKHEKNQHIMILSDGNKTHSKCPGQAKVRYEISHKGTRTSHFITQFEKTQEIQPSNYTFKDYNFEKPSSDLTVKSISEGVLGEGNIEVYRYPGRYTDTENGEQLINICMEVYDSEITTITGESQCKAFCAGFMFELQDHYRNDMNVEYLLVDIEHHPYVEYYEGIKFDSSACKEYKNTFVCIPSDVNFRPNQKTPRPVMKGCQTAIVVGQENEEIETDEHGRIHVQFHWDREGEFNEKSSCWIRVSQSTAGASWGAIVIPRIGQEVIVDFLEGNPDKPIVTGCVYHGENRPPYKLSDEKTKSTFKSDSYKGDGGFNEIRFEDLKDNEEIFIHAEKDMLTIVENDKSTEIGGKRTNTIKKDRNQAIIDGEDQLIIEKKGRTIQIPKGEYLLEAKSIKLQATSGIELTCGGGTISISKTGSITIKGTTVHIN